MKKKLLIYLFAVIGVFPSPAVGQNPYYQFTQLKQQYQSIQNPLFTISDSLFLDTNSVLAVANYQNFYLFGERVSGNVHIGKSGFIVAYSDTSDFVMDPFLISLRSNGKSEFRVKQILVGADSVLEIEWKDFGIVNHPNVDYINFKARIYYTREIMEFYYGKSNITAASPFSMPGPYVTVLHADKGFMTFKEQIWLGGNPAAPVVKTSLDTLNQFPDSGTVYRFVGRSIITGIDELNKKTKQLSVYPNPAREAVFVESDQAIDHFLLIDQLGRIAQIRGIEQGKGRIYLPLTNYSSGVYYLISNFKDGTKKQSKLILE